MEKQDTNRVFDRSIKEALQNKAEGAKPSKFLLDRINAEIDRNEKERITMSQLFKQRKVKPLIVASLIIVLTAATSFAATQVTSFVSTSTTAFDTFPTVKQVKEAVNFAPDYVESFTNGFQFKEASVSNMEALDNDKNKVDEGKGINFFYKKDGIKKGQILSLNASKQIDGMSSEVGPNEEEIPCDDFNLIYSHVTFKVAPEGYTPTDEEQQKMEQSELWLSYGSDEVEVSEVQYVKWIKDGIAYDLMDNGCGLEKDELVNMAKEVINGGNVPK